MYCEMRRCLSIWLCVFNRIKFHTVTFLPKLRVEYRIKRNDKLDKQNFVFILHLYKRAQNFGTNRCTIFFKASSGQTTPRMVWSNLEKNFCDVKILNNGCNLTTGAACTAGQQLSPNLRNKRLSSDFSKNSFKSFHPNNTRLFSLRKLLF